MTSPSTHRGTEASLSHRQETATEPMRTQANRSGRDIFAEAKAAYTIYDVWHLLGLPGTPKASCRCPWRDDSNPSFSIYAKGRKWKDHGTGESGDVVAFVMRALDIDHAEARRWFMERLGIDNPEPIQKQERPPEPRREIKWPGEFVENTPAITEAFANKRGLSYAGAHVLVESGMVRFLKVGGLKCYAVTDPLHRCAEIRRLDDGTWNDRKQYPLKGVEKAWPIGAHYFKGSSQDAGAIISEGASDFLHLVDHWTRYTKENKAGQRRWAPMGLLGASCREVHPDLVPWFRNRPVRLIPDGDPAGDQMRDNLGNYFAGLGCNVDVVKMPRGEDLRSQTLKGEIQPEGLFA